MLTSEQRCHTPFLPFPPYRYDRAYRKYIRADSVPAVFVNSEDDNAGTCLPSICKQVPSLVDADRKQLLKHIRGVLFEAADGKGTAAISEADLRSCAELSMCSAEGERCPVHGPGARRHRWWFFHAGEQLDELEGSLNRRGERESELLHVVSNDKDRLVGFWRFFVGSFVEAESEVICCKLWELFRLVVEDGC